jgi:hypothetical protein
MLRNRRLAALVALSALILLASSGCDGGNKTSAAKTGSTASPSSSTGQTYTSRAFVVPLTVTVDSSLESPPTIDSRNFLSWDSASGSEKIRFLVPVKLYRPGSSTPEPPPRTYQKYLKYLRGQTKYSVTFSKISKTTVGGRPATLMTATSDTLKVTPNSMGGSLGCAMLTAKVGFEGCFGIVPDLILRLAVIDVDGTPLLAWARTFKDNPNEAFFSVFDRMLTTVRFR